VTPAARAVRAAAPFVAIPALILGLVGLLVSGLVLAAVVFGVAAIALTAWIGFAGDSRVLAGMGGRDADPKADARLCNLVEGLSISAGVRQPRLRVIDSPGLNAIAAGTTSARSVVGVTSGLLQELNRIELEAVLAEEIVQIRRNETLPGTVVAATFGLGRGAAVLTDRDARADQAAVELTRYPPALAAALEKIEAKGSAVEGQASYMAHLWLADPGGDETPVARGRLPLRERIEALREL
jgi:heat shock protein HtpX